MTMLDRMRRHKGWLKWSLALVVAAFIVFYIPSFLRWGNQAAPADRIASVDGDAITVAEFRRIYLAQLAAYRSAYGGNVSEQLLKQLGIEQQILQQMVDERAALAEATRQGLSVTSEEVAQRILTMPAFQENGRFIGEARYQALLRMQRPPITAAEFEESLRRSLLIDKLRAALTEWMTIDDGEVEREYRKRNEKVKVEVVMLSADRFRDRVKVSDSEIASFFDAHKEDYRVGEKRRIRYVLIDYDALRSQMKATTREIERAYNTNLDMYSTPEQVRASHILFKTEGKPEAEVRARAESVLKEVKAGKDFAELARKYSEDEDTAKNGGDLDYFSRGRMVPEFEGAAFAMEPGATSDLVKTQYGFHIIKVVDKRPASIKPLEEVQQQITDQILWEKAQARATSMATAMEAEIRKPADLDKAAAAHGLKVQESLPFGQNEPIVGIGSAPEVSGTAFALNEGQVSGALNSSRGIVFLTVSGKQASYLPKFDEVKDRVREDLIRQRAGELAAAQAAAVAASLKTARDFAQAAKQLGLEAKPSELLARESAFPEVGVSAEVDRVAFSLPAGAVSNPVKTAAGAAIIRVVERKDPTPEEFAADRDRLRKELLEEAQNRFFSAYMIKAKSRMRIDINREVLQRTLGG